MCVRPVFNTSMCLCVRMEKGRVLVRVTSALLVPAWRYRKQSFCTYSSSVLRVLLRVCLFV